MLRHRKSYNKRSADHALCSGVKQSFFRKSTVLCNSIAVIDAGQLYRYWLCQHMPTGLCTHWDSDTQTFEFILQEKKGHSLEILVQRMRTDCKIENFYNRWTEKYWLLHYSWFLFSLQHCLWDYGMLSSLLPWWGNACLSQWTRYSTRSHEEKTRWMSWDVIIQKT